MRRAFIVIVGIFAVPAIGACNKNPDAKVEKAIREANLIDETNLSEMMLTMGEPKEAVAYFRDAVQQKPERIDLRRGLARSLLRAGDTRQAIQVWREILRQPQANQEDRLALADALIRNNDWAEAEAELNLVPPGLETFDRYRLEAMIADSKKNWKKADRCYAIAAGLTAKPAGVLNNWGFSKLTRGDAAAAEGLFLQSLSYDPARFATKNNLVLARAVQRKYDLPVVRMTQVERAELTYTLALAAIKQGDISIGKTLLDQAVQTHPQHFEAAARSLDALGG
jgi:Flp pilus assembly protein TadD